MDNNSATKYDGVPMPMRVGAILAVVFGVSLSVLDATIANVALPTIAQHLDIGEANSIWIVNAYQIAIVVLLLIFAALGNIVGYRRIYIWGLVTFTVASLCCALSNSFGVLVAARALQGVGAAGITSVNTALIRIIYPRRFLGRGMGLNATVVGISSVAGPTVAAAILAAASWHWIFAINIPIGVAALYLSHRFLPQNPQRSAQRRIKVRDCVLNAATFALLFMCVESYMRGWDWRLSLTATAALLTVGGYYLRTQLLESQPMLPIDLMRIPIFSLSVATSICSYLGQMTAMVALPFYLQHTLGCSNVETGLLMTAWPVIIIGVAPVAGFMVERIHAGLLGGIGLTVMSAGLLMLALLPTDASRIDIIWRMMLCGGGFALFQSPNNSLLLASAPLSRGASASGMLATARLVGQTTGATVVAMLFGVCNDSAAQMAMYMACAVAFVAAVVSFSRLRLPLPDELNRKHKK